jgi:hypothetical protein
MTGQFVDSWLRRWRARAANDDRRSDGYRTEMGFT